MNNEPTNKEEKEAANASDNITESALPESPAEALCDNNTEKASPSLDDEYALPPTTRAKGTASDKSASDDTGDYVYTHYHRVSKRHHSKSHTPSHSYSDSHKEDDLNVAIPSGKKKKKGSHQSAPSQETVDDSSVILARIKKKKHSHKHKEENTTDTEPVISNSEQHINYKKPSKWKKKPWWKKLLIILGIILSVILGLLIIAAIALVIMYFIGQSQLTDYSGMDMVAPSAPGMNVAVEDKGKRVKYNGKEYLFDEDITSILCMGIDKESLGTDDDTTGTGGQADAIYLVAFNTKTGKTDIIGIPRDTMADIGVYSPDGEYIETIHEQICLAYAYGDGKTLSCKNTLTAVERLFYNLPINSYFAMDIEAIGTLNDEIGGVTVTLNSNFTDSNGVRHYAGETVTLYGNDAVRFLRMRDVTELISTTERMNRQIDYLKSYTSKALSMIKSDLTLPIHLLDIIGDNSVTNLNPPKLTAFAKTLVFNGISEFNFKSLPGELTSDGTYAQFIVDETKLYEMILDVYYDPVS